MGLLDNKPRTYFTFNKDEGGWYWGKEKAKIDRPFWGRLQSIGMRDDSYNSGPYKGQEFKKITLVFTDDTEEEFVLSFKDSSVFAKTLLGRICNLDLEHGFTIGAFKPEDKSYVIGWAKQAGHTIEDKYRGEAGDEDYPVSKMVAEIDQTLRVLGGDSDLPKVITKMPDAPEWVSKAAKASGGKHLRTILKEAGVEDVKPFVENWANSLDMLDDWWSLAKLETDPVLLQFNTELYKHRQSELDDDLPF